jgi:allantoinase
VNIRGKNVLVGDRLIAATVVTDGGTITAVEEHGAPLDALEVPDSAYVLPGTVDTHVHINDPGRSHREGFATATRAAALGGVTTLVDMPLNSVPPTTSIAGLRAKERAARERLSVDVGMWGGAVPGNLPDLEPLWEAGVFGFKCFLVDSGVPEFPPLSPREFASALAEVTRLRGLMVVHAEDPAVLEAAPRPPSRAYADFLLSRPDQAEIRAIGQVIDGARETGGRVHILHLSSARALDLIAAAKADGIPVTAQTCPHYLCFAAESIPDAAPQFKCCPPIRDAGNRDALWAGLAAGIIDCVVSDHSPATAAEKNRDGGDLQQAWGGISGLQVGFAAVAAEAARRGHTIAEVSRWTSRATADLAGLAAKGRIAPGADADLIVYDPAAGLDVVAARLAHRNPVSPTTVTTSRGPSPARYSAARPPVPAAAVS